jgi:hypothetical protein
VNEQDQWLSWLGLAIAIVVLNDFGLGKFARYTLLAVIAYGLLTNVERLQGVGNKFVNGLSLRRGSFGPGLSSSGSW